MQISVIICTHNPRKDYLQRTLDALEKQSLPKNQWELLLVDNASAQPLAAEWNLSWHPAGRHVRETVLGLTPARLKGIEEAKGALLVFFDDDNVPCERYLEKVANMAVSLPMLGVWGAAEIVPEYEEEPRPDLVPFMRLLALRSEDCDIWKNQPGDGPLPWGAGLVVRQDVARRYLEVIRNCEIRSRLGRTGSLLTSGEDDEFSVVAAGMGYGHGLFKDLKLVHLIPRGRVQADYLKKIAFGNGFSCAVLAFIHKEALANPFFVPKAVDLWRSLRRLRVATSVQQALNLSTHLRKNPVARSIEEARSEGWMAGLKWLDELSNSGAVDFQGAVIQRMSKE
jgi:glycosyltransferase involved in cell wall biosynthesis